MHDAHATTPSPQTDPQTDPQTRAQPDRAEERHRAPDRRGADVARQVAVVVGAVLSALAGWLGSGAAGGPGQQEVGDGALAADATPVAPGEPAFTIWSVIYAGLFAYAVWQALPSRRADARQRRVGWLVVASMLLNAAWIGVVQAELLVLSVPVIVVLLAVLLVAVARLGERRASGVVEPVVLDGTLGRPGAVRWRSTRPPRAGLRAGSSGRSTHSTPREACRRGPAYRDAGRRGHYHDT